MTTRTVKIYGLAYGSSPAEITVTLDGTTVYSGTVATTDAPVPALPNTDLSTSTVEFCSFELPLEFEGTKPMTCTVTNSTVIFAQILANYCVYPTTDPIHGSGPDTYHGINSVDDSSDSRSNVFIDGVAQTLNHNEIPGTWWFKLNTGSTLSYDLVVKAGTTDVAPWWNGTIWTVVAPAPV